MPTALLPNGTVLIDDSLRSEAETVKANLRDRSVRGFRLVLEDGKEISLPTDLVHFFDNVLQGLARGGVSVTTFPNELTTTMAAEMLGVSRPTLMKWIRANEITSHQVGSHTRLKLTDVLEFGKLRRQKREEAFAALRAWEDLHERDEQ